jgi:hypothetical protein
LKQLSADRDAASNDASKIPQTGHHGNNRLLKDSPSGAVLAKPHGSAWVRAALRYGVTALAILMFPLSLRRSGERAGRFAERLETTEKANDVQRQMLEAAARRPRSRGDLVERLRDGRF